MTISASRIFSQQELIPLNKDMLWHIKSGIVRTTICTEEGKVTVLGYWGADDVVGQPLCNLETLKIECITKVEADCLNPDEWSFYLPAILRYSQMTNELMSYLINENVTHRVINILIWLRNRFGQPSSEGVLVDIYLPHYTIAELIGSTRVTVQRILGQMIKEGVIIRQKNSRLLISEKINSLTVETINNQLKWNRRASDRI